MIPYKRYARLLGRYSSSKLRGKPYVLNIEVTHRCNAQCAHCNCWQAKPGKELSDYTDIIRQFRPIIVWFTGGEPLLRKDIIQIIKKIRAADPYVYLGLATNGWLMNRELGEKLVEAGLDQMNISVEFLGKRHDEFRKIDGLFHHIEETISELGELDLCVALTCCIMRENLDSLLSIAKLAEDSGVEVGYSCYSHQKTGDKGKVITHDQLEHIQKIVATLCIWKKERGVIKSSFSYMKKIPEFFEKGTISNCQATQSWLYLTPDGHLKICPDKQIYAHHREYQRSRKMDCGECWYTCRGEMETALLERLFWELKRSRRKSPIKHFSFGP